MYNSIAEIQAANESAGLYCFRPDPLRFFNRRILRGTYPTRTGAYFVSSERFDADTPRRYTIRFCDARGVVETIGDFQGYKSATEARREAAKLQVAL